MASMYLCALVAKVLDLPRKARLIQPMHIQAGGHATPRYPTLAYPSAGQRTPAALKRRARAWVARMVKRGALDRRPCGACGEPRVQGHHLDYARPFMVEWLCAHHHHLAHHRADVPGQMVLWLGA